MAKTKTTFDKLDFIQEEGRQDIYYWSERRQRKHKGLQKSLHGFKIFAFDLNLLRSFIENFNFMVLLQMALAGLVTYACKSLDIAYNVHVTLFVSPIVFPLAFSINTDFQRKEKVLEDLANFKSSSMMWFFCMRDWRESCCLDDQYMKAIRNKIKGLLFHLREYLLTKKLDRRKFILRVIYEDLSDANQLNEKIRCSTMVANSPLVSRIIHFLNMMCLSFERLRVIREYRSPRSIRSFTKVLIFVLPIILSPYYVYLGRQDKNDWAPYYISIVVAFVFGALQGVQDKLDDPFDGMSEDDINLDTLDEWTFQSLEAIVHRSYKIGRFQVSSETTNKIHKEIDQVDGLYHKDRPTFKERHPLARISTQLEDEVQNEELGLHPYAGMLNNIQGNTTILRHGQVKKHEKSFYDLSSANNTMTYDSAKHIQFNHVVFGGDNPSQKTHKNVASTSAIIPLSSLFTSPSIDQEQINIGMNDIVYSPSLEYGVDVPNEVQYSGVASYLASVRNRTSSRNLNHDSRPSSRNSNASNQSYHSVSSRHSNSEQAMCKSSVSTRTSEKDQKKSFFYMGTPPSDNKRFNVMNVKNSSIIPLIDPNQSSIGSETVSSSDEDVKNTIPVNSSNSHSRSQPLVEALKKERSASYNGITKQMKTSPRPLQNSHSLSVLCNELKEGEVFI